MPRNPDIDISLLRAFVAVAEGGSISTAARQLHVTQGGLSQQIKRLERFFNCQLLTRDPQGSRLTERGAGLLPEARRLLALNDRVCQDMLGNTAQVRVRVGVPYDMAGAHFAPVLKAFAQRHPKVELSIVTGSSVDLMQDFTEGRVDLAISQCPVDAAVGERLAVDALVWTGGAGEAWRQRPLPLCFVTPTCTFRKTVFGLLAEAHIDWRVVFENASVDATLSTARSDLALTPWLRSLVPVDLQVLGHECGLPALPDFAIELNVSAQAGRAVLELAGVVREFYRDVGMR